MTQTNSKNQQAETPVKKSPMDQAQDHGRTYPVAKDGTVGTGVEPVYNNLDKAGKDDKTVLDVNNEQAGLQRADRTTPVEQDAPAVGSQKLDAEPNKTDEKSGDKVNQ